MEYLRRFVIALFLLMGLVTLVSLLAMSEYVRALGFVATTVVIVALWCIILEDLKGSGT